MELIVRLGDREEKVHLERGDHGHLYRITLGERVYEVDAASAGGAVRSLLIDGAQHEVSVRRQASGQHPSVGESRYRTRTQAGEEEVSVMDPLTHLALQSHGGGDAAGALQVRAYMPGRVVAILAEEGQEVVAGQGIVVLEAMKMENEIQAEKAGTIQKIWVEQGQAVDGGDPLFDLE